MVHFTFEALWQVFKHVSQSIFSNLSGVGIFLSHSAISSDFSSAPQDQRILPGDMSVLISVQI